MPIGSGDDVIQKEPGVMLFLLFWHKREKWGQDLFIQEADFFQKVNDFWKNLVDFWENLNGFWKNLTMNKEYKISFFFQNIQSDRMRSRPTSSSSIQENRRVPEKQPFTIDVW